MYDFFGMSAFACKFGNYFLSLLGPLSSWLEVLAGFDRFFTVVYPSKFRLVRKPRFQIASILLIIFVNCAIYAYQIFEYKFIRFEADEIGTCRIFGWHDPIIDLINASCVPFALMLFTSVCMFSELLKSRRRIKSSQIRQVRLRRDLKFGVNMIILNVLFFLLTSPYRVVSIFPYGLFRFHPIKQCLVYMTVEILFDLFFEVNFYAQLVSNSLVRAEFMRLSRIFLPRFLNNFINR